MNSHFDSLRYIQALERKGATSIEIWKNILKNKNYKRQLQEKSTRHQIILAMWKYLLAPKRSQEIRRIEALFKAEGKSIYTWWEVFLKCSPETKIPGFISYLRKLPAHFEMAPLCLAGIRDENWIIQRESAILLGKFGKDGLEIVPELLEVYPTCSAKNKHHFFVALKQICIADQKALDFVLPLLSASDIRLRQFALRLFRSVKPLREAHLPFILATLSDVDWSVRLESILLLSEQSCFQDQIIPALFNQFMMETPSTEVNLAYKVRGALNVLEASTQKVSPYLGQELESNDWVRQLHAIRLLQPFKTSTSTILASLFKILEKSNPLLQEEVFSTLTSWGISSPKYADQMDRFQQEQEKKQAQDLKKITAILDPLEKKQDSTEYLFETLKKCSLKNLI